MASMQSMLLVCPAVTACFGGCCSLTPTPLSAHPSGVKDEFIAYVMIMHCEPSLLTLGPEREIIEDKTETCTNLKSPQSH